VSLKAESEGLGRLLWIYVKLLLTRQSIQRVLKESGWGQDEKGTLDGRIKDLQQRIADTGLPEDVRKSLAGQVDILQQRQGKQREAVDKLAFLEAELDRIQQQVELIREQAVLATDPETVSQRIDEIAATLGGTTNWIQEQSQLYGKVEDLLDEPPSLAVPAVTEKTP
jgi:Zn-dependent oligopeptidase